jgi:alpha-tubulin suppressor-like RCC1 family protein/ribosomal protein S11
VTNAQGQATIWLPAGEYRFRTTKNGTLFWSGSSNHCSVSGCAAASITTTIPVVVTVLSTGGSAEAGLKVWAMNGSTYAGYMGTTNASGQVTLTLPQGDYRFRVDKPGYQFWSGAGNHCTVPGCTAVTVTTRDPVVVTVLDGDSHPEVGLNVLAYNGAAYAGYGGVTDAQGRATIWIPEGDYRFRAIKNATEYWSGTSNHCSIPGCTSAAIYTISDNEVTITVFDEYSQPTAGLLVEVFSPMLKDSPIPLDVFGLTDSVVDISVGLTSTCAITTQGGVKCWGVNVYGQLGDGTEITRYIPVDVVGLNSGFVQVSAGYDHTCALTASGAAKCWGNNSFGQLGNGTYSNSSVPVDVEGLTGGVRSISTAASYTCALMNSGGVKCWGRNLEGELGNGSTENSPIPVEVIGLKGVVGEMYAKWMHACVLTGTGGVQCWGANYHGELGDGSTQFSSVPVDVVGLASGVISIASGYSHTCAFMAGGVRCWGYNPSGQLGDGTRVEKHAPVNVLGLDGGVTGIIAGVENSCAFMIGGVLKCWGRNSEHQLLPSDPQDLLQATEMDWYSTEISRIGLGGYPTCILSHGNLQCWGGNFYRQLGYGPTYRNISAFTNAQGRVTFTLPPGEYSFRTRFDNQYAWSNPLSCSIPQCQDLYILQGESYDQFSLDPKAGLIL